MPTGKPARCLLLLLILALLPACGGDDDDAAGGGAPIANIPDELSALYGEYTLTVQVEYTWLAKGVTETFTRPGYVAIRASEPGVVNVPPGTSLPGIPPEAVMFGAAYVQNPVSVSIGTTDFSQHGDCGLSTMVRIGLPIGDPYLYSYDGCDATADTKHASDAFSCVPHFYGSAESYDSVNLVYFMNTVGHDGQGLATFAGYLADDHTEEAAAANQAFVHFVHQWFGEMDDIFIFREGTTYSLTVSGNQISGSFQGVARSATAMIMEDLSISAQFAGTRSP